MIGYLILGLVAVFFAVILIRTLNFKPKAQPETSQEAVSFDKDAAAEALAQLIRCKTISYSDPSLEDDAEFQKFIDPFDGIIMWTWKECDVPLIPEKFEIFKKMTENKRRMFGCYLYNFGEEKQATAEAVKWQLDWYRERILAGEAEGVVLHTNTMADLDYPAYDAAIEWMALHGDEEI